jgi:hypothetical protein
MPQAQSSPKREEDKVLQCRAHLPDKGLEHEGAPQGSIREVREFQHQK